MKSRLTSRAAKTVNNVLTVLNTMLKKAVEWGGIERMPCTVRLLPMPTPTASFHDFETYERLVTAAEELDWRAHLIVLLGGDAGLRCGEIMALESDGVDLNKRQMCVRRSEWKRQVTVPKSGRHRFVPLTTRLAAALRANRHAGRCSRRRRDRSFSRPPHQRTHTSRLADDRPTLGDSARE